MKKNSRASAQALSVGILVAAAVSAYSQPNELAVGLIAGQNTIFTFNTANPATILNEYAVTPSGGDTLVGIDYYGGNLYGVGSGGNLYTIDPNSGASSLPIHFGILQGLYYGVDASAAGIRIVSELDINMLISPAGSVLQNGPALNPSTLSITAIASYNGNLYGIDRPGGCCSSGQLYKINAGTGAMDSNIGRLGTLVSRVNGFDISAASGAAGYGWFASQAGEGVGYSQLFYVNLGTGEANTYGAFGLQSGQLVGGLTLIPPPPLVLEASHNKGGLFLFDATGLTVGKTNVLLTSTNLTSWVPVATNIAATASLTFTNTTALPRRFFRLLERP